MNPLNKVAEIIKTRQKADNLLVIVPTQRAKYFLAQSLSNSCTSALPHMFTLAELINHLTPWVELPPTQIYTCLTLYHILKTPFFDTFSSSFHFLETIAKDLNLLYNNLPLQGKEPPQFIEHILVEYYSTGSEFLDQEFTKSYKKVVEDVLGFHISKTAPRHHLQHIASIWERVAHALKPDKNNGEPSDFSNHFVQKTKELFDVPLVFEGMLMRWAAKNKDEWTPELKKLIKPEEIIAIVGGVMDRTYLHVLLALKQEYGERFFAIGFYPSKLKSIEKYILPHLRLLGEETQEHFKELTLTHQYALLGIQPQEEKIFLSTITAHHLPDRPSQVAYLNHALSSSSNNTPTLILMPREDLLPLIASTLSDANITLGMPLHLTSVHTFIELLRETRSAMLLDFNLCSGELLQRWKWHPLGRHLLTPQANSDTSASLFAPFQEVFEKEALAFIEMRTGSEKNNDIYTIFVELGDKLTRRLKQAGELTTLHGQAWHQLLLTVKTLDKISKDILSPQELLDLLTYLTYSLTVPLQSEPLNPLQIMGFLETRALSFERVFVMDATEGVVPPSPFAKSLIPEPIRLATGLPTQEIISLLYHTILFQVLLNARIVEFLVPAMDHMGRDTGPSPLIEELEWLTGTKPEIKTYTLDLKIETQEQKALQTHIQPAVSDRSDSSPKTYLQGETLSLSLSNLAILLECPRKFFFNTVLKLKAPEGFSANQFHSNIAGSVVHKVLQEIHQKDLNAACKEIDELLRNTPLLEAKTLQTLKEIVQDKLKRQELIFTQNGYTSEHLEKFLTSTTTYHDTLRLLKRVLEREGKIINDAKIKSITHEHDLTFSLEKPIQVNGKKVEVALTLRIDRIEKLQDGSIRLCELKTSASDLPTDKNSQKLKEKVHELIRGHIIPRINEVATMIKMATLNNSIKSITCTQSIGWEHNKHQRLFQLLVYGKIWNQTPDSEKISELRIYSFKAREYLSWNTEYSHEWSEEIWERLKNELLPTLIEVLTSYGPEALFKHLPPLPNIKRCGYCPFAGICGQTIKAS